MDVVLGTEPRLSAALALCGNCLLDTPRHLGETPLDARLWESIPDFGSDEVRSARERLASRAAVLRGAEGESDGATEASVEYTRLFIGPPRPAAPPWETFYRGANAAQQDGRVGYGSATAAMERRLRELGLRVADGRGQYPDHGGIELLYLSELCRRAEEGDEDAGAHLAPFASDFLDWTASWQMAIDQASPEGLYGPLLALARALATQLSAMAPA